MTDRHRSSVPRHPSTVTGVVLAAGAGTRMGQPKLLLPVDGRPLVLWVVDLVNRLPLDRRVIVLGAQAEAVRSALFPADGAHPGGRFGWTVLVNEGWREGMGSSLRCAAEEVDGGMLVFLGDMPWVPEEAARAVLARAGGRPAASAYRGVRGFPVYLPPSLRPEVRALAGDRGARDLLQDCDLIAWPDDRVIRDVDRVEDLLHA